MKSEGEKSIRNLWQKSKKKAKVSLSALRDISLGDLMDKNNKIGCREENN